MFLRLHAWLRRLADPPLFTVQIRAGVATVTRGQAPRAFAADCATIAREFGIGDGWIEGHRGPHGPRLRFSPEIPAEAHQRLRNLFGLPERLR